MDWLIVFIGIVIGAVVTAYVFCRNFVGTLRVDQSDPTDAPYLFLEIEKVWAIFPGKSMSFSESTPKAIFRTINTFCYGT